MCTKHDTRNGVHRSLADDEAAREMFALEHGGSTLADIASEENGQPARFGRPDLAFVEQECERRREVMKRRQQRQEERKKLYG